jgi:Tol biopolymer transport system component
VKALALAAAVLLSACAGGTPPSPPELPAAVRLDSRAAAGGKVRNGIIAFRIDRGAGSKMTANIYTMNPDGSQLRQLTHSAWNDQSSWSPDGKKIVYTQEPSYNGPTNRLVVMNADGSHKIALTTYADRDSVPCFSPDGTKIVFRRDASGSKLIWVMDADGTHQRHIGSGISPTYSPDGKHIVYAGAAGGLWIMDSDGSNPHALTNPASGAPIPGFAGRPPDQLHLQHRVGAERLARERRRQRRAPIDLRCFRSRIELVAG